MKRFKNFTIGGLQSKIFNLSLFTIILLTAAFITISLYHTHMLSQVVADTAEKQEASISEITGNAMDQVVRQTLGRANRMEAGFADEMFTEAGKRVSYLADCAAKLFASPGDYGPMPFAGPDPANDDAWANMVVYAPGVDAEDPAVAAKAGLVANLSDTMISMCKFFGMEDIYIGLPEGVYFAVSRGTSNWFEDGKLHEYDPRKRIWYAEAVQAGKMIFTEGEYDFDTGEYCVECAMPVYDREGSLQAVIGMDLYLDQILQALEASAVEGECSLLVNQNGIAVLPVQAEAFPMPPEDREGDLHECRNEFLAGILREALGGNRPDVALGQLEGGNYYVVAAPIMTTGWVLVSAYDQAVSGQPAALLTDRLAAVQEEATAAYQEKTGKSQLTAIVLLSAVVLLTLGGALLLGSRVVKPLNTITRRVSELKEGDLEFKMEDAYRTGDEVQELAESFAAISHRTVEYMDRIVKVTAEKERIGAELSLATQIQASMLPHIFPAFPERSEFDIFASMNPAKEVGGDFYDYFLIDDDHLCLMIADVSGKGVPAALFMMASKIILQSVAQMGKSPAEILTRTNDILCSNNEVQMFVTTWLGILELSTGKLTAANAGHEFPVLKNPGGKFELFRDKHGFVIGGMENVRYREYELQLEPGSVLFVYTDGVPEATNADNELFGTERMVDALNTLPDAAPKEVLANMRQAVNDFVKDAEQFDDLTMLCLKFRGKS